MPCQQRPTSRGLALVLDHLAAPQRPCWHYLYQLCTSKQYPLILTQSHSHIELEGHQPLQPSCGSLQHPCRQCCQAAQGGSTLSNMASHSHSDEEIMVEHVRAHLTSTSKGTEPCGPVAAARSAPAGSAARLPKASRAMTASRSGAPAATVAAEALAPDTA